MSEDQNQGPADDSPPSGSAELTGRERRLHLQAYEYWYGLLEGRRFPSISDMGREQIDLFRPQSFLVDFPQRYGEPALRFVGDDIMAEYGGDEDLVGVSIKKIPTTSILSRLSIHYMEVLSNRAPISFEAEFENARQESICYRGILLPFSDDDDDIHFIMGILTWEEKKHLPQASGGFGRAGLDEPAPDAPVEEAAVDGDAAQEEEQEDIAAEAQEDVPEEKTPSPAPAAGPVDLADALQQGRDRARSVGHVDSRSRHRLYEALADVLALYEAAEKDPEAFKKMLAEAGIRRQARAPLTPVIKLIFGSQYDKTRITEYATALLYAIGEGETSATVKDFIAGHEGGIKGCVRQARLARRAARGGQTGDAYQRALKKLRGAPALGSTPLDPALSESDEFVLLLGRNRAGGDDVEIVAVLEEKDASLEAILRRASKNLK